MAEARLPILVNSPLNYSHEANENKYWKDEGNCLGVNPDLFFPERGMSTREAKEVCASCVVRSECLEFALVNGEKFGVWGGLSERERRRIRRQRAHSRSIGGAAIPNISIADAETDEI